MLFDKTNLSNKPSKIIAKNYKTTCKLGDKFGKTQKTKIRTTSNATLHLNDEWAIF